jgi:hypothetical protein
MLSVAKLELISISNIGGTGGTGGTGGWQFIVSTPPKESCTGIPRTNSLDFAVGDNSSSITTTIKKKSIQQPIIKIDRGITNEI